MKHVILSLWCLLLLIASHSLIFVVTCGISLWMKINQGGGKKILSSDNKYIAMNLCASMLLFWFAIEQRRNLGSSTTLTQEALVYWEYKIDAYLQNLSFWLSRIKSWDITIFILGPRILALDVNHKQWLGYLYLYVVNFNSNSHLDLFNATSA